MHDIVDIIKNIQIKYLYSIYWLYWQSDYEEQSLIFNKEQIKQTCLEKYGEEYASQSEGVKEKIKQTNLNKYGFDNPIMNYNRIIKSAN